ncbi:MAG: asparagine synthase (glutamine-hydrolyzing) [Tepidisphaerales bacterium]
MCGIAGILAFSDSFRVDDDLLRRMSARIAHRGPDGAGQHLVTPANISPTTPLVALAHCRLAVLDPDPRADQPFFDQSGRSIIFNGEIYNFHELRQQIAGVNWRTTGDTEVLLAACAAWGAKAIDRLNGMYAFAFWDPATQSLLLARDRMGQKPLYYAHQPGGFLAFASEPGALLEIPWLGRDIDDTALRQYLAWGFIPDGTIYRSIRKLPPGCSLACTGGQIRIERYFRPNAPLITARDEPEAVAQTRDLVLRAVRRQLVSDVPLGCFLSGGIDSSIVAAAMRHVLGPAGQVLTFTVGFDDPAYDESQHAAEVAAHLHTKHERFVVRPNAAEDLPRLAAAFAEPFGDSSALPTHYLSLVTRQRVKVALSGDGGDELFGGYDRYRALLLSQLFSPFAPVARLAAALLPGWHPKSFGVRARRLAASLHLPPDRRYASYLRIFDDDMLDQLAPPHSGDAVTTRFAELQAAGRGLVESALAVDREIYLPEDLLAKVDRCSMLHALEVRSPFMDHELVHFAASLPAAQLLRGGGKRLLRLAFAADLPASVFRRPKMGFAVPIGQWFRDALRPMLHDLLLAKSGFCAQHLQVPTLTRLLDEHDTRHTDHAQRLYALLMLELWSGSTNK